MLAPAAGVSSVKVKRPVSVADRPATRGAVVPSVSAESTFGFTSTVALVLPCSCVLVNVSWYVAVPADGTLNVPSAAVENPCRFVSVVPWRRVRLTHRLPRPSRRSGSGCR